MGWEFGGGLGVIFFGYINMLRICQGTDSFNRELGLSLFIRMTLSFVNFTIKRKKKKTERQILNLE